MTFGLHAHLASLQRGEQRCVARGDAEFALRARHEHHARFARENLSFGADDVDMNGVGHELGLLCQCLGFLDRFFDAADHIERLLG